MRFGNPECEKCGLRHPAMGLCPDFSMPFPPQEPVVTVIDGVAVHSDKPMSDEARGWAAKIIKAARETFEAEQSARLGYDHCPED